jgi:hypothetical protein
MAKKLKAQSDGRCRYRCRVCQIARRASFAFFTRAERDACETCGSRRWKLWPDGRS